MTIRIDRALQEKYNQLAAKTNRSRNELIGMALQYALEHMEVKDSWSALSILPVQEKTPLKKIFIFVDSKEIPSHAFLHRKVFFCGIREYSVNQYSKRLFFTPKYCTFLQYTEFSKIRRKPDISAFRDISGFPCIRVKYGDEGNWTPVRKTDTPGIYERSLCFALIWPSPANRIQPDQSGEFPAALPDAGAAVVC